METFISARIVHTVCGYALISILTLATTVFSLILIIFHTTYLFLKIFMINIYKNKFIKLPIILFKFFKACSYGDL